MADLTDLTPLQGRTLTLGGIVTEQKELISKKDIPFGRVRLEDFTGSYELTLFGNAWATHKGKFTVGYFLYLEAEVRPRRYREGELELVILSVRFLSDVKETIIHQLTVTVELVMLSRAVIDGLSDILSRHPGKATLAFEVRRSDKPMQAQLRSASHRIEVTEEILDFIRSQPGLDFRIN